MPSMAKSKKKKGLRKRKKTISDGISSNDSVVDKKLNPTASTKQSSEPSESVDDGSSFTGTVLTGVSKKKKKKKKKKKLLNKNRNPDEEL
jgi:hypothetical protein